MSRDKAVLKQRLLELHGRAIDQLLESLPDDASTDFAELERRVEHLAATSLPETLSLLESSRATFPPELSALPGERARAPRPTKAKRPDAVG